MFSSQRGRQQWHREPPAAPPPPQSQVKVVGLLVPCKDYWRASRAQGPWTRAFIHSNCWHFLLANQLNDRKEARKWPQRHTNTSKDTQNHHRDAKKMSKDTETPTRFTKWSERDAKLPGRDAQQPQREGIWPQRPTNTWKESQYGHREEHHGNRMVQNKEMKKKLMYEYYI